MNGAEKAVVGSRRSRPGRGPGTPVWVLLDVVIAAVAMLVAYALSPAYGRAASAGSAIHATPFQAAILYAVFLPLISHVLGLHVLDLRMSHSHWVWRALLATALAVGGTLLTFFIFFYAMLGRWIVVQAAIYTFLFKLLSRYVLAKLIAEQPRRVVLLGRQSLAEFFGDLIKQHRAPIQVVEVIQPTVQLSEGTANSAADPAMAEVLRRVIEEWDVDEIVDGLGNGPWVTTRGQLQRCLSRGVSISTLSSFVERHFMFVPVQFIDADWFLHADIEFGHPYYFVLKRFLDLVISSVGLALTSPLLLLAALAIKIEDRGPILYSQIRTGLFNRPFRMWKLRTMSPDAEKSGPQWAKKNDERVTYVGKVLRRIRLDEVPQFYNVLMGEMSLVGPRPERPELITQLSAVIPFFEERHLVQPGLTGWAQINLPYGASVEDAQKKLSYDLYYVKHASLALDLHIMLRTFASLMRGSR
ncbi:MAG TPA: exopolysaccharide biosynthesis polyprenyl glycosylphosphotransferase [Verrucomicrobiota bacterium]|nr:exopolysaccharide biosynthesis polyprenyl glycosylphosphotransferase [Verrucomicrobiota bacterium]